MEEIIKILEEHNIKCVQNGNDLSLSHKNFYVNIENLKESYHNPCTGYFEFSNKIVMATVYYTLEYIHITVL